MGESRFEISRDARRQALLIGVGLLLVAALFIAVIAVEEWPLDWSEDLALILAPAVCIGLAAMTLRPGLRPDRYTVVVTNDAIRIGARSIAWSEIDGLRARHASIDLLQRGKRLASVRHDLDDLPFVTGLLMKHVRFAEEPPPRVFGELPKPLAFLATVLFYAAMVCLGLWILFQGRPWVGALVLVSVPVMAAQSRREVHRIELEEQGIRLRFLVGNQLVLRGDIRGFDVLAQANNVRAVAFLSEDDFVELKAHGVDPFAVWRAARAAYPELVA